MGGRLPVVQMWPSNDDPRVPTLPRAMPHTGRLTTQVRWFQEDAINFALANEAKGKGSILALDMVSLAPHPTEMLCACNCLTFAHVAFYFHHRRVSARRYVHSQVSST